MQQYLRKVRASFSGSGGSFVINPGRAMPHELKIGFTVSKGLSGTANTADIEIWNLNEGHRNAVGKELDQIVLEAGYMPPTGGSNVGVIFAGQFRDVEHTRDKQGNIITKLSCGDGDKALRHATIAKTYEEGTPVETVVEDIYKELEKEGVTRGEFKFPDDIQDKKFKRPYSVCGSCKREANVLGRGKGFYWSIQNGAMEVVPGDGYIGGVVLISPQTGMIDVPTITDNGVKVSALLNPEIRPGRRVRVESDVLEMNSANGVYRVGNVTFSGDNLDGHFRVDVQGESIGTDGKVDEGKK